MTHRSALNAAAAAVARQFGWRLAQPQPNVTKPDLGPPIPGYFRLSWPLADGDGAVCAHVVLECQGGFGAGEGKSWYKGSVFVAPADPQQNWLASALLVHQWDYPCDGPASAKATRARFVTWAHKYRNPLAPKEAEPLPPQEHRVARNRMRP